MEDPYQEYFSFLEKLGDRLDRLTAIAREKTDAVRRDDIIGVESCMKREQALSLELRTMDRQREQLLAKLGMTGVPLSGLADRCPVDIRARARAAQEKLQNRYKIYKAASQTCRTTLECNLHMFEKFIAEDQRSGANNGLTDFRA